VVVFGILVNSFYPIKKQVRVEIYSDDYEKIRKHLFDLHYLHSLTITSAMGGYSLKQKSIIVTVCLYIELPKLIREIRVVDEQCLITVTDISGIDGKLSIYRQGSTE
jgi:uncharacterized membrane-anchored protein YitT (DUF2179 family)